MYSLMHWYWWRVVWDLLVGNDDGASVKSSETYVKALKDKGAMGAIVGGGLAAVKDDLLAYLKGLSIP